MGKYNYNYSNNRINQELSPANMMCCKEYHFIYVVVLLKKKEKKKISEII